MAAATKTKKMKISKLRPHPRQAQLFTDLSATKLASLVDDLRRNGLRQPIEILPNGIIICGHQRVRAAKSLGWKEIDVVVCSDLMMQGPDAVTRRLIEDNLNRRQLTPLERARLIRTLHDIYEFESDPAKRHPRGTVLDNIATAIDISPRNAKRYLRILRTPMAVQQAFDRGKLSLVLATRVASLDAQTRKEIAARIAAGEQPTTVVTSYLPSPRPKMISPTDAYRNFLKSLRAAKDAIPRPIGKISTGVASRDAIGLFTEMVRACKGLASWSKKALKRQSPPNPVMVGLLSQQKPRRAKQNDPRRKRKTRRRSRR